MELIKPFSSIHKSDSGIAGGKGASLGEMLNAGIPVPDGFVILSTTFDEFLHKAHLLEEIDAVLGAVDHKVVHSVDEASEKIQELIKHARMPADIVDEIESQFSSLDSEFVAVRSSATAEDGADHAWAGQLDSYLNTTKDTLLEKVQHCWASLFTPRAIFYRFEKGLHTTKISVAVVVQKMVNSEKSGIAFSVHPVTEYRNQMIIEAGFGLGEAIVSGSVTPDSYVIEKEPRKIIDINISNQTRAMYRASGGGSEWVDLHKDVSSSQVLTEAEILELSELVVRIENHYGFPCDIEWAYENGKFYITQSRPITTLKEIVPIENNQKISQDISKFIQDIQNNPLEYEAGRAMYTWVANVLFSYFYKSGPWAINLPAVVSFENNNFKLYISFTQSVLDETLENFLHKNAVANIEQEIKSVSEEIRILTEATDLSTKTSLQKSFKECFSLFQSLHQCATYIRKLDKALVREVGRRFPNDTSDILSHCNTADRYSFFMQEELALCKVAKSLHADSCIDENTILEIFNTYNHITLGYFTEVSRTKKYYIDRLSTIIKDGALIVESIILKDHHDHITEREEYISRYPESKQILMLIGESGWLKDCYKFYVNKAQLSFDSLWVAASKVTGLPVEYLKDLMFEDVLDILGGKDIDENKIASYNKKSIFIAKTTEYFCHLTGTDASLFEKKYLIGNDSQGASLKGRPACKGKAQGKVVVVLSINDFSKVNSGDILVVQNTSPDFLSVLHKASAVLAEEGGITAHVSVITREFNIPAVVGLQNVTQILKDGDMVEVDANTGVITIIK